MTDEAHLLIRIRIIDSYKPKKFQKSGLESHILYHFCFSLPRISPKDTSREIKKCEARISQAFENLPDVLCAVGGLAQWHQFV